MKGLHSHSRDFWEAANKPIAIPIIATKTPTSVRIASCDQTGSVSLEMLERGLGIDGTLDVDGATRAEAAIAKNVTSKREEYPSIM